MANRPRKTKQPDLWSDLSVPILMSAAFGLGAGGTWRLCAHLVGCAAESRRLKASFRRRRRRRSNRRTFHSSPPPRRRGRWPTGTTIGGTGRMRSNIIRKRSRAALIIRMCGPISGIVFAFSGNRRKRSSNEELAQKENPLHENSFSIRPASMPKCCTMISALYRSRANSSRDFRKARGRSRRNNIIQIQGRTKRDK